MGRTRLRCEVHAAKARVGEQERETMITITLGEITIKL